MTVARPRPVPDDGGAGVTDWRRRLLCTDRDTPRALLANAVTALRDAPPWRGVLAHDAFALATVAVRAPPWEAGSNTFSERRWTAADDLLAVEWLQHAGIAVGVDVAGQTVEAVAREHPFHPVRDYLRSLAWDGTPRLERWLSTHLGARDTRFVRAAGERFLISAVARVMRPGCKADHCLLLEGEEGLLKSTALRLLAEPWFTDEIADLGSKDASMQLQGAWLVEMSELDSMSRQDISKVKAFLSRTTDRFRPPYGRRIVEQPRQAVIAGTTNYTDGYLKSETGNRRFWPVRCGRIDLDVLQRDRDQLWAEAVCQYDAGEPWWLDTPDLDRLASREQDKRFAADAWQPRIESWLDAHGADETSLGEILEQVLNLEPARWDQVAQNRVARCLRALGWTRFQRRVGGRREWRYQRHE